MRTQSVTSKISKRTIRGRMYVWNEEGLRANSMWNIDQVSETFDEIAMGVNHLGRYAMQTWEQKNNNVTYFFRGMLDPNFTH